MRPMPHLLPMEMAASGSLACSAASTAHLARLLSSLRARRPKDGLVSLWLLCPLILRTLFCSCLQLERARFERYIPKPGCILVQAVHQSLGHQESAPGYQLERLRGSRSRLAVPDGQRLCRSLLRRLHQSGTHIPYIFMSSQY